MRVGDHIEVAGRLDQALCCIADDDVAVDSDVEERPREVELAVYLRRGAEVRNEPPSGLLHIAIGTQLTARPARRVNHDIRSGVDQADIHLRAARNINAIGNNRALLRVANI